MARATAKITTTKTHYRIKVKNTGKPNSKVKSLGKVSNNTKGNKRHCPVCGKFI